LWLAIARRSKEYIVTIGVNMLFSEQFSITKTPDDDWLDIILDVDTKLWVDPFMIYQEDAGFWVNGHDIIIKHFETCFGLIAEGGMRITSVPYQKAVMLLTFKEPREFCLGYTELGTAGAGGGHGYAKLMAAAMVQAINRGLSHLRHFEELGILEKGIGPDRIGDMTCNILKYKFIEYTKGVASRHNIQTRTFMIRNARYDAARKRWVNAPHELPVNPSNNLPVLLTPQRFIRDQPFLSPEIWFESYQADELRLDMNYDVLTNVDKTLIVNTARRYSEKVREWTNLQEENATPAPYDLSKDPKGVYAWDADTSKFVRANPLELSTPTNNDEFIIFIEKIIHEYRRYIEENKGWALLWNDDGTEKDEEAAQLAFYGIARSYCVQNNINLDREVWLGRGPVDFKFSRGFELRALLEVKKLHNGDFWHGIERQVPTYLEGDDCDQAWYVGVQYRPGGISKKRAPRMAAVISNLQATSGKTVRYEGINAIPNPPSASRA
jgi:hypothetical protein